LYSGLCDALGPENVFDYPYKLSYHGQVHHYSLPNIPQGMTAPHPWLTNHPCPWEDPNVTEQQVQDMLIGKEFGLIVVESLRHIAFETCQMLRGPISQSGAPIVLHDGEDYPQILYPKVAAINPVILLKRELVRDTYPSHDFTGPGSSLRIVGFPFSCKLDAVEAAAYPSVFALDKFDLDVTFIAGRTWPERQVIANTLRDMPEDVAPRRFVALSPDDRGTSPDLKPWGGYIRTMATSLVNVNVRGFGNDTVRFWEAAACGLILTDRQHVLYNNPFSQNHNCLQYNDGADLVNQLRHWLDPARSDELLQIRGNCMNHLRAFHTNKARALYLLELLGMQSEAKE